MSCILFVSSESRPIAPADSIEFSTNLLISYHYTAIKIDHPLNNHFPKGYYKIQYKLKTSGPTFESNILEIEIREPEGIEKTIYQQISNAISISNKNDSLSILLLNQCISDHKESAYYPKAWLTYIHFLDFAKRKEYIEEAKKFIEEMPSLWYE
ncbi:hypothetical protein JW906_13225 [bacterium]|nr:hypothetical protein [bacterium]